MSKSKTDNGNLDKVVPPGACFVGDQLMSCSLWEGGCHGMTFRAHRELVGTRYHHSCEGELTHHIGMCATEVEKFLCTGHDSNCALPFADHVPHCNVRYNHFPQRDLPFSLYGKCVPNDQETLMRMDDIVRGGTCVWSEESCPHHTHTFVPATEQLLNNVHESEYNNLCTCDNVKVGACVHSVTNYFACAVSEKSCDVESHFHSWQRLAADGQDCRLCEAFDKYETVETFASLPTVEDPKCNLVGASIGGIAAGIFLTIITTLALLHRRYVSVSEEGKGGVGDGIFQGTTPMQAEGAMASTSKHDTSSSASSPVKVPEIAPSTTLLSTKRNSSSVGNRQTEPIAEDDLQAVYI